MNHAIKATLITAILIAIGLSALSQSADEKKAELARVRKELESSRKMVDSLRNAESRLVGKLNELDTRIVKDQKAINQISGELKKLRRDSDIAEKRLTSTQDEFNSTMNSFMSDVAEIYMESATPTPDPIFGFSDPAQESDITWRTMYLADISGARRRVVDSTQLAASEASARVEALTQAERDALKRKRKREASASVAKLQKDKSAQTLTTVREKREKESDRLLYLSETAKQMADLIAKLEANSETRKTIRKSSGRSQSGAFVALKGRMAPPIQGEIVATYGWKVDEKTKLKSYSPGVTIQGSPNFNVRAVADGVVAYVGFLRGYDKFVIVEHDDGYYTTYGGMSSVTAVVDQLINARDALGISTTGLVRFELRHGKESVDPALWFSFASQK